MEIWLNKWIYRGLTLNGRNKVTKAFVSSQWTQSILFRDILIENRTQVEIFQISTV
jgi:hypothetical protein